MTTLPLIFSESKPPVPSGVKGFFVYTYLFCSIPSLSLESSTMRFAVAVAALASCLAPSLSSAGKSTDLDDVLPRQSSSMMKNNRHLGGKEESRIQMRGGIRNMKRRQLVERMKKKRRFEKAVVAPLVNNNLRSSSTKSSSPDTVVECDPTKPDMGILTCGTGNYCIESRSSSIGGVCSSSSSSSSVTAGAVTETASRGLQDDFCPPNPNGCCAISEGSSYSSIYTDEDGNELFCEGRIVSTTFYLPYEQSFSYFISTCPGGGCTAQFNGVDCTCDNSQEVNCPAIDCPSPGRSGNLCDDGPEHFLPLEDICYADEPVGPPYYCSEPEGSTCCSYPFYASSTEGDYYIDENGNEALIYLKTAGTRFYLPYDQSFYYSFSTGPEGSCSATLNGIYCACDNSNIRNCPDIDCYEYEGLSGNLCDDGIDIFLPVTGLCTASDVCIVCPDDEDVTNPDNSLYDLGYSIDFTCADLQENGRQGLIDPMSCAFAQGAVPTLCGCGPGPESEVPGGSPTDMPVTEPSDMPDSGSEVPGGAPTDMPVTEPTDMPDSGSEVPGGAPTDMPVTEPTDMPDSGSEVPGGAPTDMPEPAPSDIPVAEPTRPPALPPVVTIAPLETPSLPPIVPTPQPVSPTDMPVSPPTSPPPPTDMPVSPPTSPPPPTDMPVSPTVMPVSQPTSPPPPTDMPVSPPSSPPVASPTDMPVSPSSPPVASPTPPPNPPPTPIGGFGFLVIQDNLNNGPWCISAVHRDRTDGNLELERCAFRSAGRRELTFGGLPAKQLWRFDNNNRIRSGRDSDRCIRTGLGTDLFDGIRMRLGTCDDEYTHFELDQTTTDNLKILEGDGSPSSYCVTNQGSNADDGDFIVGKPCRSSDDFEWEFVLAGVS